MAIFSAGVPPFSKAHHFGVSMSVFRGCIYIYPYIIIYIYIKLPEIKDPLPMVQDPGPAYHQFTKSHCETWSFPIRVFRVRTFPQQQGGTLLSVSSGTWIWAKYSDQPGQLVIPRDCFRIFFQNALQKRQGRCRKHTREKPFIQVWEVRYIA